MPGSTRGITLKGLVREFRMQAVARLRGARLAPGDPFSEVDYRRHRWALRELAEKHGPIFRLRFRGRELFCMTDLDAGARFLKANGMQLSAEAPDVTSLVDGGFMRKMEGAVHQKYRRSFLAAFNSLPANALEAEIRADAARFCAALAKGSAGHQALAAAAKTFATRVFLRLVLGVASEEDLDRLEGLYQNMAPDGLQSGVARLPEAKEAFSAIRRFVDEKPCDERCLLAHLRNHGQADETTIGNLVLMVEFGRYDFHGLVRWLLVELSGNPQFQAEIAAETFPATRREKCLWAVKETLRLNQSEYLHRVARQAIIFEGYYVPANARIRICVREAHRGRVFAQPDGFCPHRFRDNQYSQSHFSPLGLDRHSCLGANWVFDIAALLADEMAGNFVLSRNADSLAVVRETFHFEPGTGFSVRLQPRL